MSRTSLCGRGRGPLESQLISRARTLGLDGRFELCEGVPHDDISGCLRRMSVLVLPSLRTMKWREPFGRVLIEAMACGVPVVDSDPGANPEVTGEADIVVQEGCVEALALALHHLKDDSRLRETLRTNGQATVQTQYTNWTIAKQLAQFLMTA